MANRLIDIEGIGARQARTLENAGVLDTDRLIEVAGTASGRRKLATSTGLSEHQILEWMNRADLMRIDGVGSEYSDLLEASGVDTVKELAVRDPEDLQAKMAEINEARKLTRRTPGLAEVTKWVAEAKSMWATADPGDFWKSPSLEELARQQGVNANDFIQPSSVPRVTRQRPVHLSSASWLVTISSLI